MAIWYGHPESLRGTRKKKSTDDTDLLSCFAWLYKKEKAAISRKSSRNEIIDSFFLATFQKQK